MRILVLDGKLLNKYRSLPQFEGVELKSFDQRGKFEDTPLHVASYNGWVEDLKIMLAGSIDINVKGDIGNTPLHDAVSGGSISAIDLLLNNGAESQAPNDYGDRPLDLVDDKIKKEVYFVFNKYR